MDLKDLKITPLEGSTVKELLKRAGSIIECSHHVATVHSKSRNAWENLLIFEDSNTKKFSYAFGLDREASLALAALLIKGVDAIDKMSSGGNA